MSTQYIIDDVLLCKMSTLVTSYVQRWGTEKRGMLTHIEETDVDMKINIHIIDGSILPDQAHTYTSKIQFIYSNSKPNCLFLILCACVQWLRLCICAVPNRDSTVSVDVFHCLNICIQLRVAVQVSSAAPL